MSSYFPTLFAATPSKHLSVHDWLRHFATSPNLGFNSISCSAGQQELIILRALISSTSLDNESDSITWRWNSSGTFSAKSAYNFLTFDGIDNRKCAFLWNLRIPLKIKIFQWLAFRYKLLTADLLAKRGWIGPSICSLCRTGEENLDHLFFLCPFAKSVWTASLCDGVLFCNRFLSSPGDLTSRWKTARATLSGQSKSTFYLLVAAGCWEIWNERNRRTFENRLSTVDFCAFKVHSMADFWGLLCYTPDCF